MMPFLLLIHSLIGNDTDTFRFTEVFITVGAYYLIMVTLATWLLRWLEKRFHVPGFGAR